jgi:hypothetical protein
VNDREDSDRPHMTPMDASPYAGPAASPAYGLAGQHPKRRSGDHFPGRRRHHETAFRVTEPALAETPFHP